MIDFKKINIAIKRVHSRDGWGESLFTKTTKHKCFAGVIDTCRRKGRIYLVKREDKKEFYFGLFCEKCAKVWVEHNKKRTLEKLDKVDLMKVRFLIEIC